MTCYITEEGASLTIIKQTGRSGGRGVVYDVEGHPAMVAKIFKPEFRDDERHKKVQALVPALNGVKGVIAPFGCLYDEKGSFAGFTMEKATGDTLFRVIRSQRLSLSYRVQLGYEFTKIVRRLHARRIIVGDLDSHNIMVSPDGSVKLIDADSFQLPGDGCICPVHEAHCKSPEMLRYGLTGALLSEESDSFLLGYCLHWLVFLADPFLDPLETAEGADRFEVQTNNIATGTFAYRESPEALPSTIAGAGLAQLFSDCFTGHPPAVRLWESCLRTLLEQRFERCQCGWEVPTSLAACPCCGKKMIRLGGGEAQGMHARTSSKAIARASSKKLPLRCFGSKTTVAAASLKAATVCCALLAVAAFWNVTLLDAQAALDAFASIDVGETAGEILNQVAGLLPSIDIATMAVDAFGDAVSSVTQGASRAFDVVSSELLATLGGVATGVFEGIAGVVSMADQGLESLVQNVCEGVGSLW